MDFGGVFMIIKVETKHQLKIFIHYIETLYKDDSLVVYPIFASITKELRREVLETKKYTALLAYKDNQIVGRLMYTIDTSKKQGKDVCYFSFFDLSLIHI